MTVRRVRADARWGNVVGAIGAADTTFTFAEDPAFPTLDGTNHVAVILEPDVPAQREVVYVTAMSGATATTVVRAQENTTAKTHPAGCRWIHGPTKRDESAGRMVFHRRTAGDYSLTNASITGWINLDTGTDLVLPAQAGDLVVIGVAALFGSQNVEINMDALIVASASRWSGGTDDGVAAWKGNPAVFTNVGAAVPRVLVAGDISGGNVTLRLQWRPGTANVTKTLFAGIARPFWWWARNEGPQESF